MTNAAQLAHALLSGPITPERVRKLQRHVIDSPTLRAAVLALLPADVQTTVNATLPE